MRTCDAVIVSNAESVKLMQTTMKCIRSLQASEKPNTFNIIVREKEHAAEFPGCKVYRQDPEFNYNNELNKGAKAGTAQYIAFCNNDLIFERGWFTEIIKAMDLYNLDSASPWCPNAHGNIHGRPGKIVTERRAQGIRSIPMKFTPEPVYIGYKIRDHIAGWCFVMTREAYNRMGGFPTDYEFHYADNTMAERMIEFDVRHGLVSASHVLHLESVTLRTRDRKTQEIYTTEAKKRYERERKNQNRPA